MMVSLPLVNLLGPYAARWAAARLLSESDSSRREGEGAPSSRNLAKLAGPSGEMTRTVDASAVQVGPGRRFCEI